jgi:hypothetical protein
MFVAILAQCWKPLVLVALVAAALIYRTILVKERDAARAQVAAVSAQAQQFKAADDACVAAVAQQNAAVEKLQSDEALAIRAAETREANVVADAETRAAQAKSQADALVNAKVGAGCDAAIKWANQQAPALGKW